MRKLFLNSFNPKELSRKLGKPKRVAFKASWLNKPPLPRVFYLADDVSSFQTKILLTKGGDHLRPNDLLVAPPRLHRGLKRMRIKKTFLDTIIVEYLPPLRRRLRAGEPLMMIGTTCEQGKVV